MLLDCHFWGRKIDVMIVIAIATAAAAAVVVVFVVAIVVWMINCPGLLSHTILSNSLDIEYEMATNNLFPNFVTSRQEASYGQHYPCPALYCFLVVVKL